MCNCITQLSGQLKAYNTAIDVSINLSSNVPVKAIVKTYKDDESKRQKAMTLIASYCPFCGEKYEATLEATPAPRSPSVAADSGGGDHA